jgi:hypothetical protein
VTDIWRRRSDHQKRFESPGAISISAPCVSINGMTVDKDGDVINWKFDRWRQPYGARLWQIVAATEYLGWASDPKAHPQERLLST